MIKLILLTVVVVNTSLFAENLSNKALFVRCYKLLTQSFPDPDLPILQNVENGTVSDPIDACVSMLNDVNFNSSLTLTSQSTTNKNILRTFHNIHYSWFTNKIYSSSDGPRDNQYNNDILDTDAPALHITKAMFAPGASFADIFTVNEFLAAKRSGGELTIAPNTKLAKTESPYNTMTNYKFVEGGDLIGIKRLSSMQVTENRGTSSVISFNEQWGGGVLGSNYYVYQTVPQLRNYSSDGGANVPRKWSESVLKDFLCRDLPVIRFSDAQPFIEPASSYAFRHGGDCVQCHATMDRLAGSIRDLRPSLTDVRSGRGMRWIRKWGSNNASVVDYTWPITRDRDYNKKGYGNTFYYRQYNGNKIDRNFPNLDSFGAYLASINDPYVCAAKRYYQYFTGHNANIEDLETGTATAKVLSAKEAYHRSRVIQLGEQFAQSKNIKALIESILREDLFKDSGYIKR